MRACSVLELMTAENGFGSAYGFLRNIRNETRGANIALMCEQSENLRVPRRSPDEQATFPILSSFLLDVLNFFDMQRIDPSRASKSAAPLAAAMTGQIDIGCAR